MYKRLLFVLCLSAHLGFAQDFSRLDTLLQRMENHDKLMGSVAITKDGKVVFSRAVGRKDLKNANDINTLFRIGSISKTFTATLLMKAVEEKKISLDQKLGDFYPQIPLAEKITLAQLLSHRSGIHNFTSSPTYMQWYTRPQTREELLKIMVNGGSVFEPGSKEEYSNSNYVLLSFILEKIHNAPFDKILDQQIIQPLQLKHTRYGSKIEADKNEALSYLYMGTWMLYPETDLSIPLGAGGIVSTPSDILQFAEALFSGKILKKETVEEMKTGYGLFSVPYKDTPGYGHTGGIDGFKSIFAYFPEKKLGIAITLNAIAISPTILNKEVRKAAFGEEVELHDFTPIHLSDEVLQAYVGVYSGAELPIKISVSNKGGKLYAQATGQLPFQLEAVTQDTFQFFPSGIEMQFSDGELKFKQGGKTYTLSKE